MSLKSPITDASGPVVHVALASVSLIYGFFYVAVKLLLTEIEEPQLILLRFVLTGMVVAIVEWGFLKTRFQSGLDLVKVLGLGVLGVLIVQNLVVMGIHRTTAFHAALIMATIPMMTLTWSIMLRREVFLPQKLVGILIAFVGVALLLFNRHADSVLPPTYLTGDLIILLNSLAFSWYLIGSQSLLKRYPSFSLMAYCYMVSAVLYAGLFSAGAVPGLTTGASLAFMGRLSPLGWLLVAYVVGFASIGSYTLNNYALRRINPSEVAIYIFTQPVLAALFGYLILGEVFTLNMGLAALVTFAGMMLAMSAKKKPQVAV